MRREHSNSKPPGRTRYASKETARHAVWDALAHAKAARFPFPPHGRIPNFVAAQEAAQRLFAHPLFRTARRIKINPDAPQRYLRILALEHAITLYVPTPRLRGGFRCFDPALIPADQIQSAASLTKGARWAQDVAVTDLPPLDLIVTGSVAVTRAGKRCGKGHGYADLEYAILRELGHPPAPVVTTVHDLQIVHDFPTEAHDLPVSVIATPTTSIDVPEPPPPPTGIDWTRLSAADLAAMPILRELRTAGR